MQEEQQDCKAAGEALAVDSPYFAYQLTGHPSIPYHKGVTPWTRACCSTDKCPVNPRGAAAITGASYDVETCVSVRSSSVTHWPDDPDELCSDQLAVRLREVLALPLTVQVGAVGAAESLPCVALPAESVV